MTGRPSVKIDWIRASTPDYPLPPLLVAVVFYALVFLMVTIFWFAVWSMGAFVWRTSDQSFVIAILGFVIPFISIYSIIKSLPFSRWLAAIQLASPPLLVLYLVREKLVDWNISIYFWIVVWLVVLAGIGNLFFGRNMRRYYAWVRGEQGAGSWASPRWGRINQWVSGHEAEIYLFFEIVFLLFALFVLIIPWVVM